MTRNAHDGWTAEVQEQIQPGDPWAAPPPLDERPADWMTCGIGGCDFTVERGEARDMALHRDEDHPAAPLPLDGLREAASTLYEAVREYGTSWDTDDSGCRYCGTIGRPTTHTDDCILAALRTALRDEGDTR